MNWQMKFGLSARIKEHTDPVKLTKSPLAMTFKNVDELKEFLLQLSKQPGIDRSLSSALIASAKAFVTSSSEYLMGAGDVLSKLLSKENKNLPADLVTEIKSAIGEIDKAFRIANG